jgi:hypothetical protein
MSRLYWINYTLDDIDHSNAILDTSSEWVVYYFIYLSPQLY